MPGRFLKKIILLTILIVAATFASAQSTASAQGNMWQLNYNLGFTQFYGDVSSSGYFSKLSGQISMATGASARWYLNPTIGIGGNFLYGNLKSMKDNRASGADTDFTFTGKYFDANAHVIVDFSNLLWGVQNRKVSIYGTLGIGYATWQSELVDNIEGTTTVSGDAIDDDTYKNVGFSMPVSLGVNYFINNNWALNLDISLRTVFDDDVDVWRDGFKYDQPLYTGFGISYFINRNISRTSKSAKTRKANAPVNPQNTKNKKRVVSGAEPAIIQQSPIDPNAIIPFYDYSYKKTKNNNSSTSEQKPTTSNKPVATPSTGIVYRVQILAVSKKIVDINTLKTKYNLRKDIHMNYFGGIYRYSAGSFTTYQEALSYSHILKSKGIKDAFAVAYDNDIKITITTEMKKH